MDLESIKIPLLAGDRASIHLLVRDVRMRNAIIITQRDRKAINDGEGFAIELFPDLPSQGKECHKEVLKLSQSSMHTTATAQRGQVSAGAKQRPCLFAVATKEPHGDKRCRHDLGISHVLLAVFPLVTRVQEVVTDTIDREDVVVHGGPPRAGVGG
jgi:hypothetical protein